VKKLHWFWALALASCAAEVGSIEGGILGDSDGDGDPDASDCAPMDPAIHAGAAEICNGVDDDCDGDADEPVAGHYCVDHEDVSPPATQCSEELMVGRLAMAGAPCPPAPPGWAGGALFDHVDIGYCAYRATTDPPDVGALPPRDDGLPWDQWLEGDCMVVSALSPTDAEAASLAVWEDYRAGWLAQVEHLPALPSFFGTQPYPDAAHVAVLDSADGFGPYYVSPLPSRNAVTTPHGAAMGLLIDEIACPEGHFGPPCASEFTNHVALPALGDGTLIADGGAIGGFADAARSIDEAIGARPARSHRNLVINLSIGAEAFYEQGAAGRRPSAQALRDVLAHAVCVEDALVFAAAGNVTGRGGSSGAMVPAAWGADSTWCGRPFVVPVGGVTPDDSLIQATRAGSVPELVAPARSAVVDLTGGTGSPEPTALLTGTSLGAAVASAAAAVLWSYAPSMTAADVQAALYDSATALPALGAADLCHGGICSGVRRVSVCAAAERGVDEMCMRDPALAGSPFCSMPAPRLGCTTRPAGSGAPVALSAASIGSLPPSSVVASASGLLGDSVSGDECSLPSYSTDAASLPSNPDLCPLDQYPTPSASPYGLGSQPDTPPCRVCAMKLSASTLWIYVNDAVTGTLYAPTMTTSGGAYYLGPVVGSTLSSGASYEITGLGVGSSPWATLSFPYLDGTGKKRVLTQEIELW